MSTSSMPTFLDILKDAYEQRRMERENAELKAENAALKAENAALREDKARLVEILKCWKKVVDDCHNETRDTGFGEYDVTVGLICDTRAAIDSARKEAQP